LGLWAGYQSVHAFLPNSLWYGTNYSAHYPHARFVSSFLRSQSPPEGGKLTVYWPTDVRYIWFSAEANSYFNWVQMSGCAFNPGTALEGRRRGGLVKPFELVYLHRLPLTDSWRGAFADFYQDWYDAPPTRGDLVQLCRDRLLDYVVLQHPIDGLYC